MKIEIKKDKNNLIKLSKPNKKLNKKINLDYSHNINPKTSLLNSNIELRLNLSELNNKPIKHLNLYSNENRIKNSQLILPSIQNTLTVNKKLNRNYSMNNIFRNNCFCPIKKGNIKIKKIKLKRLKKTSSYKRKKRLIKIYNENLLMKEKLEKYKENENKENMDSFSYKNYNRHLLEYSSLDLSLKTFKTFKKNMKIIGNKLKGEKVEPYNRWLIFLEKIGKFAPEELKKKVISLSKKEYQENTDYSL